MGIDYDAWLGKPYQDAYAAQERMDELEEKFVETDNFKEAYEEWAEENPAPTKDLFMATKLYETMLEIYAESQDEREDYNY